MEVMHKTSPRSNHFCSGFIAFGARSGARQDPEPCSQRLDLQSERGRVVEKAKTGKLRNGAPAGRRPAYRFCLSTKEESYEKISRCFFGTLNYDCNYCFFTNARSGRR